MRPILFHLPLPGGHDLQVPAYGVFMVAGMLLAVWLSGRHGWRLGLTRTDVLDLGFLLVFCGVIASHLAHAALEPELYFRGDGLGAGLLRLATVWQGGLVYYGGLAGGLVALWLWSRRKGVPFLDAADLVAPLGAVGLASTRVGCFLNGCCYGKPAILPWTVTYPPGSLAQQRQASLGLVSDEAPALPVHPVQLYEGLAAVLIFWLLWKWFPRRRFGGEIAAAYLVLYGAWRFLAESLRADSPGWTPEPGGFLNVFQWVSLGLVIVAGAGWWLGARRGRRVSCLVCDGPVSRPRSDRDLRGPRR